MKLEENEINKKLANRENNLQPESFQEHLRLEEELRVYSIKYVKILDKFNKKEGQIINLASFVHTVSDLSMDRIKSRIWFYGYN